MALSYHEINSIGRTQLGTGGSIHQFSLPARCRSPRRQQAAVRVCASAPSCEFANSVVVCGGGIGGLAAAVGLQKVGIPCVVLEQAPHLREAGAAIMMQSNAWRALEQLGVADELRATHMAVDWLEAYSRKGVRLNGVEVASCAHGPHEMRGVVRNDLQATLAGALAEGVIRTSAGVASVSDFEEGPIVEMQDGSRYKAKVVVGADGVMSKVGASLGLERAQYAGWSAYRGMAFFDDGLPDQSRAFRVIQGGPEGQIVGIYPVSRTCAYYFCGFRASEDYAKECKDKAAMRADLERRVRGLPLHMEAVVAHTPDSHLYLNVIGDRKVRAGEPLGRGTVTVIGDAAHPTTPALGQGGCMALEDAVTLAATLRDACYPTGKPGNADMAAAFAGADPAAIAAALRAMECERTARCALLVEMASQNGKRSVMPSSLPAVWFRDFMISTFGYNPKTQLEYTSWWQPSPL